ncbi:MAG: ATP-dependent sacrificial sulfur transferase LarE [Candidatus Aenigmatarchaeota archaeon]
MDETEIERRWRELLDWYEENDVTKALVAFSGGKDSTLVLDSALEALEDVKAVIVDDVIYPEKETTEAKERAEEMGAEHEILRTDKLSNENFRANPPDRCYYCKKELFESIDGDGVILEGTNATEVEGHRPGLKGVEECARAPLLESGITEDEVREILKWRGRKVWDRPSFACIASRFPPGRELTEEELKKVERIENRLFDLGIKQLRIRHFGDTARIEVWPEDMKIVIDNRKKIVRWLKKEGYDKMFLDLEGYITGSISHEGGR